MKNQVAELIVDLGGGSISGFQLIENGLNPLQWDSAGEGFVPDEERNQRPRSMGHFLCLDRWGSVSDAEKANGMPCHGEATTVMWDVLQQPVSKNGVVEARLSANLPLADLSVERKILMYDNSAVVSVVESIANNNPIGRIYNIVQHPTIGGLFLDEDTIVDANGTRGFMQDRPMPNPEVPEVRWPEAIKLDGTKVDVRNLRDDQEPGVVSYIVDDEYGWITASSPNSGLLMGYIWLSSDYPWMNLWRNLREGKPYARGLEFGTSGLHRPGRDLVAKGRIFDRALYRYIDVSETQSFTYAMFLVEIPKDFEGVDSVSYKDGKLTVVEAGSNNRSFERSAANLF